jgi:hypothetical protein
MESFSAAPGLRPYLEQFPRESHGGGDSINFRRFSQHENCSRHGMCGSLLLLQSLRINRKITCRFPNSQWMMIGFAPKGRLFPQPKAPPWEKGEFFPLFRPDGPKIPGESSARWAEGFLDLFLRPQGVALGWENRRPSAETWAVNSSVHANTFFPLICRSLYNEANLISRKAAKNENDEPSSPRGSCRTFDQERLRWNAISRVIEKSAIAATSLVRARASAANVSNTIYDPANCRRVAFPTTRNEPTTAPSTISPGWSAKERSK